MLEEKILFYTLTKDWPNLAVFEVEKMEKYHDHMFTDDLNNAVYDDIFMRISDKNLLTRTAKIMEIVVKQNPRQMVYLDTYANVLYKLGRTREALALEEKAFAASPGNEETAANFKKMKAGKPTWPKE